jgi:hypothetical protein
MKLKQSKRKDAKVRKVNALQRTGDFIFGWAGSSRNVSALSGVSLKKILKRIFASFAPLRLCVGCFFMPSVARFHVF